MWGVWWSPVRRGAAFWVVLCSHCNHPKLLICLGPGVPLAGSLDLQTQQITGHDTRGFCISSPSLRCLATGFSLCATRKFAASEGTGTTWTQSPPNAGKLLSIRVDKPSPPIWGNFVFCGRYVKQNTVNVRVFVNSIARRMQATRAKDQQQAVLSSPSHSLWR